MEKCEDLAAQRSPLVVIMHEEQVTVSEIHPVAKAKLASQIPPHKASIRTPLLCNFVSIRRRRTSAVERPQKGNHQGHREEDQGVTLGCKD